MYLVVEHSAQGQTAVWRHQPRDGGRQLRERPRQNVGHAHTEARGLWFLRVLARERENDIVWPNSGPGQKIEEGGGGLKGKFPNLGMGAVLGIE